MNSFTNLDPVMFWALALCIAVVFGIVTCATMVLFAWGERPAQRDINEESKLRERLSQIAEPTAMPSGKSA